ncbi:MAG: glutamine-hydrolyzing GMP synthase [Myxococcota bacterium]
MSTRKNRILILDFGSQYTQLIARRVRECGVYSEIRPFHTPLTSLQAEGFSGIILSGGPASVYAPDAPTLSRDLFDWGVPILGVCYGLQLMTHLLGGHVVPGTEREYGRAELDVIASDPLFHGMGEGIPETVWMSHGDRVDVLPPGFRVIARSQNSPVGAFSDPTRQLYGVQFHPEVSHTEHGEVLLRNFLFQICKLEADWSLGSFIDEQLEHLRARIGKQHVVLALSGGVDSTVVAALLSRAIGKQLHCIFVDNGLLRFGEAHRVEQLLRTHMELDLRVVDAQERFLTRLAGVTDPEQKRRIIGHEFIAVFEEVAHHLPEVQFLAQGTLYPDVIESVSLKGPSATIKSHHNVGGLPERMKLALVEPLRELFKDEVRRLGEALGLPSEVVYRQPFPGPGLAVRILGEVTPERVALLQRADLIVQEEVAAAALERRLWQSFAVLLPIRTVGVMGDERTYEHVAALRAVNSTDGMTADWARLPYDLLERISRRMTNEVKGISRVVFDISSKPPSTIEWE